MATEVVDKRQKIFILAGIDKYKKLMLEKMFHKAGADVLEIRFKEFDGTWKQSEAINIFRTSADKKHLELPVLSASQE